MNVVPKAVLSVGQLQVLVSAHRDEFLGECVNEGMSHDEALQCLCDFETETLSRIYDPSQESPNT